MKFLQEIERLQRLDRLIRLKATGTPSELAYRLNVSERTVYNQIDTLRALGAPVSFCKSKQSYFYLYDVEIHLGFERVKQ
jgi:predicted DNA-binding transcriptional regulator YafY